MTIEEMLMAAKLLSAIAILGAMTSVSMFFLLDIKKAFHIVTGRTYKMRYKKKDVRNSPMVKSSTPRTNSSVSDELVTRVLDMSMSYEEIYEPTVVLNSGSMEETMILGDRVNKIEMLVDITYIHTEIIIW